MYQPSVRSATVGTGKTLLALVAILSLLLSAFAVARPVLATHGSEDAKGSLPLVAADKECQDEGFDFGFKLDNLDQVDEGIYTFESEDGTFSGSIQLIDTDHDEKGEVDDFELLSADPEPDGVLVKQPVEGGGISHITFCFFVPPEISVDKTGDSISKIGDEVDYTITITNTSTTITAHKVSITDTLAGDLTANPGCGDSLAPGEDCQITYTLTVADNAGDPWVNEVTAVYSSRAGGAGGRATEKATHSVDLFQPSVTVDKAGPATAEVGNTITYTITVTNTSSTDSPNLVLASVNDTLLDNATVLAAAEAAGCDELAADDAPCAFTVDYTVQEGDPDPLPNTVTLTYNPADFPNEVFDSDGHEVDLQQPQAPLGSITVLKDVVAACEICETETPGAFLNQGGGDGSDRDQFAQESLNTDPIVIGEVEYDYAAAQATQPGSLLWHYIGLELNVRYDAEVLDCDLSLLIYNGSVEALQNMTVGQILQAANDFLSGEDTESFTEQQLHDAIAEINESDEGDDILVCDDTTTTGANGFEFALSDKDGNAVDSGATGDDGDGTLVFEDLDVALSPYTLVETAGPDPDLECRIVSATGTGVSFDEETGVITITLTEENPDVTVTVTNACEGVQPPPPPPPPGQGLLEIEKWLCEGTGATFFTDPSDPKPMGPSIAQVDEDEADDCTRAGGVSFSIHTYDPETETVSDAPVATAVTNDDPEEGQLGVAHVTLDEGWYVVVEDSTGAMSDPLEIEDGSLTVISVFNFAGEAPGAVGWVKIIKWFCTGDEDGVLFVLPGESSPNPANPALECESGSATFAVVFDDENDDQVVGHISVGNDGVGLSQPLEEGDYWLVELDEAGDPLATSHGTVTVSDGQIVSVVVFNFAEGEQGEEVNEGEQPGGGVGPAREDTRSGGGGPREGTLGGNPLPNTAMEAPTGTVPAALLALVMLSGIGAAAYAVRAEERRRR